MTKVLVKKILLLAFMLGMMSMADAQEFITTWKTDNPGTSGDNEITIPTTGTGYNYTVDWGDGSSDTGVTGSITHTYTSVGTYTVSISGDFPRIYFDDSGDKEKILTIEEWGDIAWDDMGRAFYGCIHLNITATDAPDLSGVTSMQDMFNGALSLNADINHWDVSTITTLSNTFFGASAFNQDLNSWNVSNVTNMFQTFARATSFNGNISSWDVSNVSTLYGTFFQTPFNQNITGWDVSNVGNMTATFRENTVFNQDISGWDVSNVTQFLVMFQQASAFNQDITGWDVSSGINFSSMFKNADSFNQPIGSWDMSSATAIREMFMQNDAFNQPVDTWDISGVSDLTSTFLQATSFNQDISSWDVSGVTNMTNLFNGATAFNQDLGDWDVSGVTNMFGIFNFSGLSKANYDNILDGWSQLTLQDDVTFGASGKEYCFGAAARQTIIDNHNWSFTDGGEVCNAFITTWKTDNAGTSGDDEITIPIFGSATYDYDVDWGDGNSDANVTGGITHTYASAGTYTVTITGDFPRIFFDDAGDKEKILTVEQWGDIRWESMDESFFGCTNLRIPTTDAPDLSRVTSLRRMFLFASSMNEPIGHWDVSTITTMEGMFAGADIFNQDIGDWDVSNVTNFDVMFDDADDFNQDIGDWDVSSATSMETMFRKAFDFNQDISSWDVSNVIDMSTMFQAATSFNQPIGAWDVSNVTDLVNMFRAATAFNQDLSNWDVSNVTRASGIFFGALSFNGNVSNWDVSGIDDMTSFFNQASSFNQDITGWDVSAATTMSSMFNSASSFNQDLSGWDVSGVTNMTAIFNSSDLSKSNYDKILNGWSQLTLQNDVTLGGTGVQYCNGADARQFIIDNFNWSFGDAGENCRAFITTWKTDNPGTSNDDQITISTYGTGFTFDYTVDWGDGNSDTGVTGDITHTYDAAGTYTVSITGDFPNIYFLNQNDKEKILSIEQWGDIAWGGSINFWGCVNMINNATDSPNLSIVTSLSSMFRDASSFDGDLSNWDVSNITNMFGMFNGASTFNGDISTWDVSNVTDMNFLFARTDAFNSDISSWDVSNVISALGMFQTATSFNQAIGNWDVSSMTNMSSMFRNAVAFNQDISSWDVSNVTNMSNMFAGADIFNIDIGNWDVSNVTNISVMFADTDEFNQDLSSWDVSNVTTLDRTFLRAVGFNGNVENWDVSSVNDMANLFDRASSFNQDLSGWDVSAVTDMTQMLDDTDLSKANYDKILDGWSQLTLQNDVTLGADGIAYCNGATERQSIIDTYNWTINDAGENCRAFITTWQTDNTGTSNDDQITIPTEGTGYNYTVDWGDGNSDTGVTGDITHTYASAGTYTVSITGDFPRIYFNDGGDKDKILMVEQWGDIAWTSMQNAFFGCSNLNSSATDAPDLSRVTSLFATFSQASSFNGNIDHWDVSNIEQLATTFFEATSFNQPLNSWDVSNVINMNNLFNGATSFNQELSNWDVSNVAVFASMFLNSTFDQDISMWDVSSGVSFQSMFRNSPFNQYIGEWNTSLAGSMSSMFSLASSFDQDLSAWDVSSVTNMTNMFDNSGLSTTNYDKTLEGWSLLALEDDVTFDAAGIAFCEAASARQSIIDNFNWTINDDGENCFVNIPDANFKAALLANTSINTLDDGEISIQEAEDFTGTIDINNQSIADLTGIEAFINLSTLWAWSNNITSVDLSSNTELVQLILNDNNLGSIDLSSNSKLSSLQLMNCRLASGIDLSNLTDLTALALSNNGFSTIDLSNAASLSDLRLDNTNLTSLDLSANTSITQLRLAGSPITALDVTSLTSLRTFYFDNSVVEELDLSQNGDLITLSIINNDVITTIDLRNSNNEDLENFSVRNTASLSCISVDDRAFARNNWTDVDNIDVFKFSCEASDIVNIPDANFKAALLANTEINTTDDGEITVGEAEAFTGTISAPSAGISDLVGIEYFHNITGVSLASNSLTLADFSNNTKLESVFVNNNAITFLDVDQCSDLVDLRVYNNGSLGNVDVTENPLLEILWVANNGLTSLDVSNNPELRDIWASGSNSLTSIDLSNNPELFKLLIVDNDLTSLDLSQNPLLEDVRISSNDLSALDMRNGANELITNFEAGSNPNLTCISVDNPAYSAANWTDIDAASSFSFSCDKNAVVDIPDANLKTALLANTSINTTDDGEITYGEAEAFAGTIEVNNLEISDMTGIEAFINITRLDAVGNGFASLEIDNSTVLEILQVENNALTEIDLSNNTELTSLRIFGNELAELDLSSNTQITYLQASSNELSTLDVTGLTALQNLFIGSNNLTDLDLSQNTALQTLEIINNDFAALDVANNPALTTISIANNSVSVLDLTQNTALTRIWVGNNELTSLDLSQNVAATELSLSGNQLTSLDIANGNNANVISFDATSNPDLTCITVDDVAFATANFTNVDDAANFSTDCSNVETDILTFIFAEQTGAPTIDNVNHTIIAEVTVGTDLTSLAPTFTLSSGATASPASDEAQDFTSSVTYTVTAENPNVEQDWVVTVVEENVAPTDISLSTSSIDENNSIGDLIGSFSTTDANSGDAHAYSLVSGDGDNDNGSFSIDVDALEAAEAFDFETKASYSIRVETNDGNGETFQRVFTISINDVDENVAPTDISLSASSIDENNSIGDVIGSFSTTDSNNGDSHTYSLVSGDGDTDNASFSIDVDALEAAEAFDFETKASYSIRVETNDGNGETFQKVFTISINDVDENVAPTDISLSASSIDENNSIGDVIGSFSTTDANSGDAHIYSLVNGDGDMDNASFSIDVDALEAAEAFDFETKASYSIRVETNDGNGGTFQKAFTITINDVDENVAPEIDQAIADQSEEEGFGSTTVSLENVFTDANGDVLTFSAISSDDNVVSVSLNNNILTITEAGLGSSTISVTADDGNGGTVTDEFVFTVTEAPLGLEDELNLKVYPNPVVEQLHIESEQDITIKLSDLNGRILKQETGRTISLNITAYSKGIYMLTIQKGEERISKRIIKAN